MVQHAFGVGNPRVLFTLRASRRGHSDVGARDGDEAVGQGDVDNCDGEQRVGKIMYECCAQTAAPEGKKAKRR